MEPLVLIIPHRLGKEEALRRIKPATITAASVTTETSSLMKTMIEFNSNYIYGIFLTFAIGYVILVIPIGLLTTSLSNRLAVRR